MKCIKCKGEWTPPHGITVTECPFCKESFAPTKVSKTYSSVKDALAFIADTYGVDALLTKNLFSDIAPNLRDELELIKMFKEKGALEVLKDALDSSPFEQCNAIKRAVARLPLYLQKSPDVISLMNNFAEVLNWHVSELWSPQLFQTNTITRNVCGDINMPNTSKIISFGCYEWRVLDVQDGRALLLSDKIIEKKRYHSNLTSNTWVECELREYLNGSFYDSFGEEKTRIAETQISNPKNLWIGTIGGNSTRDRIFLLSLEEVDKYFGNSRDYVNKIRKCWNNVEMKFQQDSDGCYMSNEHNQTRIAEDIDGEACWWWLRSPGKKSKNSSSATLVNANGLVSIDGNIVIQNSGGVRPALWLKSVI